MSVCVCVCVCLCVRKIDAGVGKFLGMRESKREEEREKERLSMKRVTSLVLTHTHAHTHTHTLCAAPLAESQPPHINSPLPHSRSLVLSSSALFRHSLVAFRFLFYKSLLPLSLSLSLIRSFFFLGRDVVYYSLFVSAGGKPLRQKRGGRERAASGEGTCALSLSAFVALILSLYAFSCATHTHTQKHKQIHTRPNGAPLTIAFSHLPRSHLAAHPHTLSYVPTRPLSLDALR